MNQVAIITANVGGIDNPLPIPEQTIPYDYFCFTRESPELQSPELQALDDRMLSRYPKFNMHKVKPGYKFYIWMDSSVEVTSHNFIKFMLTDLINIKIALHPDRLTIGEELDFIIEQLEKGGEYLTPRYEIIDIEHQQEYIDPYTHYTLYCLRVFCILNDNYINEFQENAFSEMEGYGSYDQVIWSYLLKQSPSIEIARYYEPSNGHYRLAGHALLK